MFSSLNLHYRELKNGKIVDQVGIQNSRFGPFTVMLSIKVTEFSVTAVAL